MITNVQTGTNIEEIQQGIYRINTPVEVIPGGFSFNQYLIADEHPLLFHTGPRKMFPLVLEAVRSIIPPESLRYVSFSHVESDECGSLNQWLEIAPAAVPLCGETAAIVQMNDLADREPRPMADLETVSLGRHKVQWIDTPHLPHAWECGYLFEQTTQTLLCGDLFTQPGVGKSALAASDILQPSEEFRTIPGMDYFSHCKNAGALIQRLIDKQPRTLACMHGSAWQGNGADLLRSLSKRLTADEPRAVLTAP